MQNSDCKEHSKKILVSVGICAYNEEKNIEKLIRSVFKQNIRQVSIEEVIVIVDGCSDRTEQILRNSPEFGKIILINQKERCGKYAAVNKFLEVAKCPVLALISADVILDDFALERLCLPFFDEGVGMTGAHPVPLDSKDTFIGYVTNLQWRLHHQISLIQPKFGELIAFRNIINSLPATLVDEEQIASIISACGYGAQYIPEAVIYNKGPANLKDFFIQRKRVYIGHLYLKKKI